MSSKKLIKKESYSADELKFADDIRNIVSANLGRVYSTINYAQINSNWCIGQRIVEQEQQGKDRAEYGKRVIAIASQVLTKEYGKGYSETNIRNFRKFYIQFKDYQIQQTASAEFGIDFQQTLSAESGNAIGQTASDQFVRQLSLLPWSHYERLMRVSDKTAREWYMHEAFKEMWSFRKLDRNIRTQYYERMILSQMSPEVRNEMQQKTDKYQHDKFEFIKNPTVLEFIGLKGNIGYTETKIEQAIIDNMEHFLLEMGKGFALVARQQLIRTPAQDYYVDLVFYNYLLKCFVLIDLKQDKVTYQDVGQMDMYVKMYDELRRGEGDNPTIGIVLCSETDENIARYSVLKGNEQLFATKYQLILPSPKELQEEISRQTALLHLQLGDKTDDDSL